ncbi:MAG: hypothetical protein ABI434_00410 [Burkholderiaceae bacterium]
MNIQNPDNAVNRRAGSVASDLSSSAAEQADKAIAATMRATDSAAQSVHAGLENLQNKVPGMLSQAGTTADDYLAQGVQRARDASSALRESTGRAQDRAVGYIRAEPLQAVLVAAGVGALVALVLSRRSRD